MSPILRGPGCAALLILMFSACDPSPVSVTQSDAAADGRHNEECGPQDPRCKDAGAGDPGATACALEGASEARVRYDRAEASAERPCGAEAQARVCRDGRWSPWSGTFAHEYCVGEPIRGCDGGAEGASQARVRYREAIGSAEAPCEAETQTRSCMNGEWSQWSGSSAEDTCVMRGDISRPCDTSPSSSKDARVRYREPSVAFGMRCVAEVQARTCEDGTWSPWSGSYDEPDCREAPARPCGSVAHGTTEARVRYANKLVSFGESCQPETQTRVCQDGTFSAWSGEHEETGCAVSPSGASILVAPAGGEVATIEGGPAVALTFATSLAPSAPVDITLSSSDARGITLTQPQLVLDAGSTAAKSTAISAARTLAAEGKRFVLLRGEVKSADVRFDGLAIGPWTISIDDQGKAGLVITELSARVTSDDGGEAMFEVSLARAPSSDVTVYVTSSDTTEGVPAPGRLVFTSANFAAPQLVTVRGVDDAPQVDGDVSFEVLINTVSADAGYGSLPFEHLSFESHDAPVNECARATWNTCSSAEVCLDKEPGFACACPPGQERQGQGCVSVPSVSTGDWHTCLRKGGGQASCWGINQYAQAALPSGPAYVAVSAGKEHTCALEASGKIACVGRIYAAAPTAAPGARWVDVRSGSGFSCALDTLGDITCFGSDLAHRLAPRRQEPRRFRSLRVRDLDICAQDDTYAITCTRAEENASALPLPVAPDGTHFERFDISSQLCAIDSNGGLTCAPDRWGNLRVTPPALPVGVGYRELALDYSSFSCAIDDTGALHCWGRPSDGAPEEALDVPQLPEGVGFKSVAVNNSRVCALDTLGELHCWGFDSAGQAQVPDPVTGGAWESLDSSSVHTCAIDRQGNLNCWGWYDDEPTAPDGAHWTAVQTAAPIFYTPSSTCAVDSAGGGQCWGNAQTAPELAAGEAWKELAAGHSLACGVTRAGALRCRNATAPSLAEGVHWVHVDAYGEYACATDSTGTLHCFGSTRAPIAIAQREGGFSQIDLKQGIVCGIHGAGLMDCWDVEGRSANSTRPALPAGAGWTHIALANVSRYSSHVCGLDTLGNAYCWGGTNTYGFNDVPALEPGVVWTDVETGEEFSCGLDSRGRRHCWGLRKLSPF